MLVLHLIRNVERTGISGIITFSNSHGADYPSPMWKRLLAVIVIILRTFLRLQGCVWSNTRATTSMTPLTTTTTDRRIMGYISSTISTGADGGAQNTPLAGR